MDQDKLIRSLRLQLRLERAVILLVAIFFLVRWGYGQLQSRPFAIYINGRPVVYLTTHESADRVLANIKSSVQGLKPSEVSFKEKVIIKRADQDKKVETEAQATKTALDVLTLQVKKPAILIDGVPAVAVNTKEDANVVLEMAKQKYGSRTVNLMEEPGFKEQVDVREMTVDLDLYRDKPEDALDVLFGGLGGGSQPGIYVVQSGDVAVKIARITGMTLSELEALNPGKDLAKLQIGEQLRISETGGKPSSRKQPRLTVVTRSQSTRIESVPYTTETVSSVRLPSGKQVELSPGRNGTRQVLVADNYENGVRTGSEVVEETIIRPPVPRRVAVGIK